MSPKLRTFSFRPLPGLFALAAIVLLASCKGIPTKGEKAAREQMKEVTGGYRPNGQKPALPVLRSDSSLSNFLAYAMLNQPSVEAAYYDWAASVERITEARSFPDPAFAFQMDVQKVVTSVMPGLMGIFRGRTSCGWERKLHRRKARPNIFRFRRQCCERHLK